MIHPRRVISVVALGALSFGPAAPVAAAPDPIKVKVEVQEIAVLSVVEGSATGIMDDPNPTSVGSTSLFGPPIGTAQLALDTNFCVGLEFDFPTVTGLRPNPGAIYGRGVGQGNGHTLGMMPFFVVEGTTKQFGGTSPLLGSTTPSPLSLSAASGGLCNGVYDIFVGAVTQWDLTLPPEPMFAEPDTYSIPVTVSLVP